MQTWIKANIGKLIDRITKAETAIGSPYENENDLDDRTTALENAVGMPYNAPLNLSTRVYNLELNPGYSDDYTRTVQEVGKWVDGKTIYKYTTYNDSVPQGGSVSFTPGSGYVIDTLIKAEAIYSYRDSAYDLQFVGTVGNSGRTIQIYYDANNNIAVAELNGIYEYKDVYVTYWYTRRAVE